MKSNLLQKQKLAHRKEKVLWGGGKLRNIIFIIVFLFFLLFLGALLIWLLIKHLSILPIRDIEIVGDPYEGILWFEHLEEELKGRAFLQLDKEYWEQQFQLVPSVKSMNWQYHYPSHLRIVLEIKTPLAIILRKGDNGASEGDYVDDKGTIFPSFDGNFLSLPVLRGFAIPEESGSGFLLEVLAELSLLSKVDGGLYEALEGIEKQSRSGGFFDLRLCSYVYKPCVLIESYQFKLLKLRDVFRLWAVLDSSDEEEYSRRFRVLDFRSHGLAIW